MSNLTTHHNQRHIYSKQSNNIAYMYVKLKLQISNSDTYFPVCRVTRAKAVGATSSVCGGFLVWFQIGLPCVTCMQQTFVLAFTVADMRRVAAYWRQTHSRRLQPLG